MRHFSILFIFTSWFFSSSFLTRLLLCGLCFHRMFVSCRWVSFIFSLASHVTMLSFFSSLFETFECSVSFWKHNKNKTRGRSRMRVLFHVRPHRQNSSAVRVCASHGRPKDCRLQHVFGISCCIQMSRRINWSPRRPNLFQKVRKHRRKKRKTKRQVQFSVTYFNQVPSVGRPSVKLQR